MVNLLKEIGLFAKTVVWQWWSLMSCALWTFAGIFGAALNKSGEWYVKTSFWLGGAVLCIAIFCAWQKEHRAKLELERTAETRDRLAELMHKGQILEAGLSYCTMSAEFVGWDHQEDGWKSEVSAYLFDLGYANYSAEFVRAGTEADSVVEVDTANKRQNRIGRIRLYHKALENISARLTDN